MYLIKIDEALYQIKQRIKMHELGGTTNSANEREKAILDYITNLQEENERLKEENKHIFANVNDDKLLISNAMNWTKANDLQQRIDKAIQIIELIKPELWNISNKMTYKLIDIENILKGEE